MTQNTYMILSLGLAVVGTAASIFQAVDSIKNGDKRAALAGAACGQQLGALMSNGTITLNGRQITGVDKNGNYIDENGQIIK